MALWLRARIVAEADDRVAPRSRGEGVSHIRQGEFEVVLGVAGDGVEQGAAGYDGAFCEEAKDVGDEVLHMRFKSRDGGEGGRGGERDGGCVAIDHRAGGSRSHVDVVKGGSGIGFG